MFNLPTTPEAARTTRKQVLGRMEGTTPGEWYVAKYGEIGSRHIEAGSQSQVPESFLDEADCALAATAPETNQLLAALLEAHAQMLEHIRRAQVAIVNFRTDAPHLDYDAIGEAEHALQEAYPLQTDPTQVEEVWQEVQEKAALWDGLMSMARIRPLGWAGMDSNGEVQEMDSRGNPNNNYAHLCVELWTRYPEPADFPSQDAHEKGKNLLTGIARIATAIASEQRQALK